MLCRCDRFRSTLVESRKYHKTYVIDTATTRSATRMNSDVTAACRWALRATRGPARAARGVRPPVRGGGARPPRWGSCRCAPPYSTPAGPL